MNNKLLKNITFMLIFMIIQHILLITEWKYYLDMISHIQGEKFNFFKNERFTITIVFIFTIGYITLLLIMMYYTDVFTINLKSLIFILVLYGFWDLAYYVMFDKAEKFSLVLLYDILVVGGVCLLLTQYIFNNYYNILKNYTFVLVIFYFTTMVLFFYEFYKYNPDLSNIKKYVLF